MNGAEYFGKAALGTRAEAEWIVCESCKLLLYGKRFSRHAKVCPECGWHSSLTATERLALLLDPGSMTTVQPGASVRDPLGFTDLKPYTGRLVAARQATGLDDAVLVAHGTVHDRPVVAAVMDFRFLGGSLGSAAGEAVATAAETALGCGSPLLLVTASGGARMQEGAISLMQMARTSNAMAAMDEAGLLTLTLITDPTFGGVSASFVTLADVLIAEPGARMGFAGPRVIEQTVRQRLPERFQTAEFLLEHGLVDTVLPRAEVPRMVANLLGVADAPDERWGADVRDPMLRDPRRLTPPPVEETVRRARELGRPTTMDHIAGWLDDFVELHGDRTGEDCRALVGGLARLDGLPVMVIGHQKGHDLDALVRNNFGMPSPAGYRKAARLMRLAAKLRVPVITLIDTPGAHPGVDAERGGQAHAIAECLRVMGSLPVPIVAVVNGEGGSGGALALAVADRVLMCENAIYSVISPEGCAAILWRDAERRAEAAAALRLGARSLLELGVIDGVVPEPAGGAHNRPDRAGRLVHDAVVCALRDLRRMPGVQLVSARRARFRRFGSPAA
ncbi:acetyl-CoA carboxylase carboxyltransferase subunit alpha/beta [Nonomuraea wenchangensis]